LIDDTPTGLSFSWTDYCKTVAHSTIRRDLPRCRW
jgi:hypothetical protein